jgi:hypothetical protein
MAILKSRVQKANAPADSGKPPEFLIRAMNDDLKGFAKGNRGICDPRALLVLVKRLQALDAVLRDLGISLFEYGTDGKIIDNPEVLAKFRAVNRFLWRYEATPSITPEFMSDANPHSRGWELSWGRTGKRAQPFFELNLVLKILKIASAGRISSLKQCENCRKWLYARFPHQRFCLGDCKDRFHQTNEADKKRRREWAKKNYWAHKALDLGKKNIK